MTSTSSNKPPLKISTHTTVDPSRPAMPRTPPRSPANASAGKISFGVKHDDIKSNIVDTHGRSRPDIGRESLITDKLPRLASIDLIDEDFGQDEDYRRPKVKVGDRDPAADNKENIGNGRVNLREQIDSKQKQAAQERIEKADIRSEGKDDTESIEFDWKLEEKKRGTATLNNQQIKATIPKLAVNQQKPSLNIGLQKQSAKNLKGKDSDSENSWD